MQKCCEKPTHYGAFIDDHCDIRDAVKSNASIPDFAVMPAQKVLRSIPPLPEYANDI